MRDGSDGTPSCGHGCKAPTTWEKGRKNGLQSQCFGNRRAFLVRTEVQALLFRERRRKLQRFMPERDAGSLLWEKAGLQGQCFEGASVSIPCDLWKNLRKSLIGAFDGNSFLWCGMRGDLGCVKAESKQKEGESAMKRSLIAFFLILALLLTSSSLPCFAGSDILRMITEKRRKQRRTRL